MSYWKSSGSRKASALFFTILFSVLTLAAIGVLTGVSPAITAHAATEVEITSSMASDLEIEYGTTPSSSYAWTVSYGGTDNTVLIAPVGTITQKTDAGTSFAFTIITDYSDTYDFVLGSDQFYIVIVPRADNVTASKPMLYYGDAISPSSKLYTNSITGESFTVEYMVYTGGTEQATSTTPALTTCTIKLSDSYKSDSVGKNYDLSISSSTTVTIQKRPLVVSLNTTTKTYGDSLSLSTDNYTLLLEPFVFPSTGYGGSGTVAVVNDDTLGLTLNCSGASSSAAVGNFNVSVAAGYNSNYNIKLISASQSVTVVPRSLTIDSSSIIGYDSSLFTFAYRDEIALGSVSVRGYFSESLTIGLSTLATAGNHVGAYPVQFDSAYAGNSAALSNYNVIMDLDISISPKSVSYTPDGALSKFYGNVSDLSFPMTVGTDTLYAIFTSDVDNTTSAGQGYALTYLSCSNSDYVLEEESVSGLSLTITPRAVTLDAGAVPGGSITFSKTYLTAMPTLTYSVQGVNGEYFDVTFIASSSWAHAYTGCGTYSVYTRNGEVLDYTVSDSNYVLTLLHASKVMLVVVPAAAAVIKVVSVIYGEAIPTPAVLSDTSITGFSYQFYQGATQLLSSPKNVGEYKVVCTLSNNNFVLVEGDEEFTFTITKRPITVTAQSLSKNQGQQMSLSPSNYTLSYTGDSEKTALAEGDSSLFGGLVSDGLSAAAEAGEYPITASITNDLNPNYDITFVEGVLTVVPVEVSVKLDPPVVELSDLEVSESGVKLSSSSSLEGIQFQLEGTSTWKSRLTNLDPGTYTVFVRYSGDESQGTLASDPVEIVVVISGGADNPVDPEPVDIKGGLLAIAVIMSLLAAAAVAVFFTVTLPKYKIRG